MSAWFYEHGGMSLHVAFLSLLSVSAIEVYYMYSVSLLIVEIAKKYCQRSENKYTTNNNFIYSIFTAYIVIYTFY